MHCFILNGKALPIHWLTTVDVVRDDFCDVYLRSYIFVAAIRMTSSSRDIYFHTPSRN